MNEHACKQEFRIQSLEKKADVLTEGQHDLERTLAVMAERMDNTNAHLAEVKEILRAFPEAERATWEDHWDKVFERQNKILFKVILGLLGLITVLGGAIVAVVNFVAK